LCYSSRHTVSAFRHRRKIMQPTRFIRSSRLVFLLATSWSCARHAVVRSPEVSPMQAQLSAEKPRVSERRHVSRTTTMLRAGTRDATRGVSHAGPTLSGGTRGWLASVVRWPKHERLARISKSNHAHRMARHGWNADQGTTNGRHPDQGPIRRFRTRAGLEDRNGG